MPQVAAKPAVNDLDHDLRENGEGRILAFAARLETWERILRAAEVPSPGGSIRFFLRLLHNALRCEAWVESVVWGLNPYSAAGSPIEPS